MATLKDVEILNKVGEETAGRILPKIRKQFLEDFSNAMKPLNLSICAEKGISENEIGSLPPETQFESIDVVIHLLKAALWLAEKKAIIGM